MRKDIYYLITFCFSICVIPYIVITLDFWTKPQLLIFAVFYGIELFICGLNLGKDVYGK